MGAVLLGIIFWTSHRLFFSNSEFSIQKVETQTDGTLSREQILELARIPNSGNIFQIDLLRIQNHLENLDFIRSANVERHLPGTLKIALSERRPVAWLSGSPLGNGLPREEDSAFLLDSEGVPMRGDSLHAGFGALPVILETSRARVRPGVALDSPVLLGAVRLCADWPGEAPQMAEIRRLNDYSFEARFQSGTTAIFGVHDLERQISDLKLILNRANSSNLQIATVNLLMKRNIPITMGPNNTPPNHLRAVSGRNKN